VEFFVRHVLHLIKHVLVVHLKAKNKREKVNGAAKYENAVMKK
jgi:hypothetical protein